ncbi:MAG: pyridoxamine 5'-phosphate oxidase family protein [Ruminiclostridium sp.]|nr:pyridoxamine 5'-phosphate oxidase family protein [Ruminiclostridium sp.]MBQ5584078.1 pyridoxamine 5'-phosphate oxidase family protein [Ruminiclostridium sp.]
MERKMHKIARQMPDAEARELFEKGHHGILALNGDEGYPYAVPVNYVYLNEKIYIHSAKVGYKMDALQKDSKCCFSAILSSEILPKQVTAAFESIIATGKVNLVEDEAERRTAMETFVHRFCVDAIDEGMAFLEKALAKTAVLRIDVEQLTGKAYRGGQF